MNDIFEVFPAAPAGDGIVVGVRPVVAPLANFRQPSGLEIVGISTSRFRDADIVFLLYGL